MTERPVVDGTLRLRGRYRGRNWWVEVNLYAVAIIVLWTIVVALVSRGRR